MLRVACLIPNRSACLPRMWPGERRFAQRLEEKLDDDYLVWYDVPIGPRRRHPDFLILHPSRGFLVIEVKDWKIDTIVEFDRMSVTLATERGLVHEINPLAQARSYANELNGLLQVDPALRQPEGHPHGGKSIVPYGIGVVLANITRADFEANDLGDVVPAHKVICKDEMLESADPEAFQARLWAMFDAAFACRLTLPQIDRFRYHVFPELRIAPTPSQAALFEGAAALEAIPDLIRIMDLQQEQLARSLGDGHRVIHGVAGSGKTMILGYRCMHLARSLTKPVLVLCFNRALAARLHALMTEKALEDRVTVRHFHGWCVDMLRAYHVPMPREQGDAFVSALVPAVIGGVESNAIPRAQYGAVMIDEGHDFEPEWFRLIVQMLDPSTNSLLLLYDDAQSIYGGERRKKFSFSSVGIEARGRTTVLKLNYRNTVEILAVARKFADDLFRAQDADDDGVPLLTPQSAGRRGASPELVRCASFDAEIALIVDKISEAQARGRSLDDVAVICHRKDQCERFARELQRHGIPHRQANASGKSNLFEGVPSVKLLTMHSSKGLEFGLVCIPAICGLPRRQESALEDARLLYVAMTRALDTLVITHHATSVFTERLRESLIAVESALTDV